MKQSLLQRTIQKMRKSQLKKLEILSYIQEHEPQLLGSEKKMIRLRECSNILRFINY